ncbi:MAG: EAL domain-containing protein [Desulfobacteraceae bacterium]|nr:EAL domain-containing protein [Desulfobacteraceae bacterium]
MKPAPDPYRHALANLPFPVILLDQDRRPQFLNRAAWDFLSQVWPAGAPSQLPPWLAAEIETFAASPVAESGLEKKLDGPGGSSYFQVNLRKNGDGGIIVTVSDLSNIRFAEECLREMVHGLSEATGEAFFQFLVQHLAKGVGADYAFICEYCEQNRAWVKTVAVYADGTLIENFTFELANTPCEMVVGGPGLCCYSRGVQEKFPLDHLAIELDVESYVGVPLVDSKGRVLGPMAVFGREPLRNRQLAESMLQIFAARASAELERMQAEEVLKETKGRLKTIVDSVQTGIILIEAASRRIVDVNDVAAAMIGTPKHRLVGAICHDTICPQAPGHCPVIDRGEPIENCEKLLLTAAGAKLPVIKNVASVMLNGRKHLLESFVDISGRKQAELEIQTLAYYDTLTGLPNRAFLQDRLGEALVGRPGSRPFAVMFLDLDRFKDINDTLGHVFGDGMLKEVAARLIGCFRKNDTVLRLGGDEFVVILPEVENERDIANIARKILNILSEPIILDEHEIFTSGSIGIALYPADGQDMETLLKHADTAMYRAKDQGRNNFQFFSQEMNLQAVEQRQMETSLRHALTTGELFLVYQPQMEIRTGRLVGVEALLRWRHPEQGVLLPSTFIGLAEKTGLIIPIGEWVLRAACRQGQAWQTAGHPPLRIAVNLSGRQFKQYNLTGIIEQILAQTGFDPSCLELELTESTLMENAESTVNVLKDLRHMGINLAIDDFGTGYSSLSHLRQFPIDRLKIDRSFVREITTNADVAAIAEAIIAMAHSLKLKVLAEGIERQDQLDFLAGRQCDEMQGFLLSPPVIAREITRFLARENTSPSFSFAPLPRPSEA